MAYNVSDRYKEVIYGGDYSHQLKIWFNGNEFTDADLYCEKLTIKKGILADGSNNFSLSNFRSQSIELVLHGADESVIATPIKISIGTLVDDAYEYVPIGTFNIDDTPTTDQGKITITATDNSSKFDFNYNAKDIIDAGGGSTTKYKIFNDICTQAGVSTGITSFIGSDELVGTYDNSITARNYISYLAEQAGCIASIDREGRLIFVNILGLTTWNISIDVIESYSIGLHYKIGQLIYESGVIKYETDESTDDILYINSANPYINSETLNNIKSSVIGFEIDSFSTGKILGNPAIDSYDLISITDGNNTYTTLATYTLTYSGNMIQKFDTELTKDEVESNVTINSNKTFKKTIKSEIDNVEAEMKITAEQVDEQNTKISQITQTVDELNSKISDIADITTSNESIYGTVSLENINESEPIMIKIHPTSGNISYLYPSSGLYPSSSTYLKTRTLRFYNTKTEEIIDWELPTNLWYYDSDNYDELILSYDSLSLMVNRKIGINEDGTTYILDNPTTESYDFPSIQLTEGNYTVTLLGYSNAYLFVRLMASNIYTSQFATKVELNSAITQTESSITASVEEKVTKIDGEIDTISGELALKVGKNDNDQVVSMLNASANEINLTSNRLSIDSDNFTLSKEGNLKCTNAEISGIINEYEESTGLLAIKIKDTQIKFYEFSESGNLTGDIGSVINTGEPEKSGIALTCAKDKYLALDYRIDDNTAINILKFDSNDTTKTPYIINTASGTLFPENDGGGIVVENGLIKSWDMNTASGTLFPENDGGGIVVENGLIKSWSLTTLSDDIDLGNGTTLKVRDGLIIGYI